MSGSYFPQQQKYIDSVETAHMSAVKIIGLLESIIRAQSRLLVQYRTGNNKAPEWVFDILDKAKANGIDV